MADEVNVRTVTLVDLDAASESDFGVTQRLTVNSRTAGPRLGRDVQVAIKGSKSGDWSVSEDGSVTAGGLALFEGEFSLETVVADGSPGVSGTSQASSRATGLFDARRFAGIEAAVAETGSITASLRRFGINDYLRQSTVLSSSGSVL